MSKKSEKAALLKNRNVYKGILFAEGYNATYKEFKDTFEEIHIFANLQPEAREIALKEAYKAATNGNTKPSVTESKGDK